MREGLAISLKAPAGMWTNFQRLSIQYEVTDDAHLSWTAYRIRAMLAHVRKMFDEGAAKRQHGNALDEVFACIGRNEKVDQKKQRRMLRIGDRPHPLPFFRDPEVTGATEEDDEEPIEAIAKYFAAADYSANI